MQEGPEQVQREEAWSREEQTETETKTGQQLAGKNLRHSRTEGQRWAPRWTEKGMWVEGGSFVLGPGKGGDPCKVSGQGRETRASGWAPSAITGGLGDLGRWLGLPMSPLSFLLQGPCTHSQV